MATKASEWFEDEAAGGATPPFRVSPEKTLIPDAPAGALARPALLERLDPTRRRLTVLICPGGFGKTTLLADCCRRAEARGDRVLWLSVDERDDAARVVAHLTFAADVEWGRQDAQAEPVQSVALHYLDALMATVRNSDDRWVLAVDELDRIPASGAGIINHLISRGPANLHVGLAGRDLPRGIDVATLVAEGRGIAVGHRQLRFTRLEVASYFDGALPPNRARETWRDTEGWPIAVCLQRNLAEAGLVEVPELSVNWVAARMFRGMSESDRRFLLDAGCFEWADARMFDAVLGVGASERLRHLGAVRGLVDGLDGGATFRLHPLIRRHAEHELRLRGEGSEVRRRIAQALAERGRTVDAVRQAIQGEDPDLAAEIVERAGAVRLVLTGGVRGLQDAVGLLPAEAIAKSPRLALARLATDALDNGVSDPRTTASLLSLAAGNVEVPAEDDDEDLQLDRLLVRGIFLMCGCASIGSDASRSALLEGERAIARTGLDPTVAGGISYGQAIYRFQAGDVRDALVRVRRVREFAAACPSMALSASILEGWILFAAGDVPDSEATLQKAQRKARSDFPGHESPALTGDVLFAEVAIETGRHLAAHRRVLEFPKLATVGAWLDVYAAAVDVAVELRLGRDRSANIEDILQRAWEFAVSRSLMTFCRWLAAMRVSALVREGCLDQAKALWRETGLPDDLERQVDLTQQSWREMEAICCAQVRLLLAEGDCGAALTLARTFCAVAREKGLARVESWATALAVNAAELAGDQATAEEALVEYLHLFRRTGFSRALTANPELARTVLERLDTADRELDSARDALLAMLAQPDGGPSLALTPRELEVLALLDAPNKKIGRALGLTVNGVRYHVKNILRKLAVPNRREAMGKARSLGLSPLPPHDHE